MQALSPAAVPQHMAIIMDGNRHWAARRGLPRALGHASGARRVRQIVKACSARGVRYLTLFAFITENWQRPADEVSRLMSLMVHYLQKEVSDDMHKNGVRLKVVGDLSRFDKRLQNLMANAQALTAHNSKITLTIAANPALTVAAMDEAALGPTSAWAMRPTPTCSSAPVVSRASATSSCGKWLTPSCFLPTRSGPTSRPSRWMMPCSGTPDASVASGLLPSAPLDERSSAWPQELSFRATRHREAAGRGDPSLIRRSHGLPRCARNDAAVIEVETELNALSK